MATALATAGLLAGIFGSTLAPVAQAAGNVNVKKIWSELTDPVNVYDDWAQVAGGTSATGATAYPDGDPWVIYAPYYNDGAATDGSIDWAACSGVGDGSIEDLSGDDISNNDDVTVSVSATGGALVSLYTNGGGYSGDYSDWSVGSTSLDVGSSGFDVCVTAPDDDSSFATTLTVKVNGEALKPIYAVIIGPAQTATLQDKTIAAGTTDTHGWIAMDNTGVDYAARLRVFDKQGANMISWIGTLSDVEDYAISGYESDGYNVEYTVGAQPKGSDFSTLVEAGASAKKVDVNADFCDSAADEVGDLKVVTPVFDYDGGGTLTSSDKVQTAGAITLEGIGKGGAELDAAQIDGAKAAAAIMAMNNIYYRFVHLVGDADYQTMPARLRMNVIGSPGIDKIDFEIYSLAVSAVNGCGLCIEAHEKQLRKHQVSREAIQSAIRIAAVVHAVAVTLEAAQSTAAADVADAA